MGFYDLIGYVIPSWSTPQSTFDARPREHDFDDYKVYDKFEFLIYHDKNTGKLQISPDRIPLSRVKSIADHHNIGVVLKSLNLRSYMNRSNCKVEFKFRFSYHDTSKEDFDEPKVDVMPNTPPYGVPTTVIYKHPLPIDMYFYLFPIYKNDLLNPQVEVFSKESDERHISRDSIFHKVYCDLKRPFIEFLNAKKMFEIDPMMYSSKTSGYDWLKASAIEEFIKYLKLEVYTKIKFLDVNTSFIELKILDNVDSFKVENFIEKCQFKTQDGLCASVVQIGVRTDYIAVRKHNSSYGKSRAVAQQFRDITQGEVKFQEFLNHSFVPKRTESKSIIQGPPPEALRVIEDKMKQVIEKRRLTREIISN